MLFSDDSRFVSIAIRVSIAITQRKPRVRVIVPESERRRSGRERVAINYAEKYGLDDDDDVAAARRRVVSSTRKKQNLASMSDGDFARRRFSVGARVYDSELGVTCHWCRQKTVETHVFCTAEACGKGRRAPLAFCGMCLRNRHGEDVDAAVASGIWECPRCRGSCGDGCVTCCNCGPCRKAHGLAPTHQVIQLARGAGFDNVHDYLVHGATGLSPAALLERKKSFEWGKWLAEGFRPAKTRPLASTKTASEGAKADEAQENGKAVDKDAGKKAGFQQDLEPVANPHHRAAACSVVQNGLHDWRARGKGAAAKIVAIGETAGDDHQIGGIKAIFLVPDQCRPPSCQLLDSNHHVAVTVRPRENRDRDAKRAQAHASSPSSISIS